MSRTRSRPSLTSVRPAERKSSSRLCLKSDSVHWILSYCSNVHSRKWRKRKRPDTDQLRRCRSDRAGSADSGIFVNLDTEGEEKRQAKQGSKKKSVRRSFQASSLDTATSTRATGAASVHRRHPYSPRQSSPDSGRPPPHASPFKDRVSGRLTALGNRKGINTHFRGKGRRTGGSRGQREVLVFDRATDGGHAHTVVESPVRDSFTAVEAPNCPLGAVRG